MPDDPMLARDFCDEVDGLPALVDAAALFHLPPRGSLCLSRGNAIPQNTKAQQQLFHLPPCRLSSR